MIISYVTVSLVVIVYLTLVVMFLFQAYHSKFTDPPKLLGNMALLPLRTSYKGPAPKDSELFVS